MLDALFVLFFRLQEMTLLARSGCRWMCLLNALALALCFCLALLTL